MQNKSLLIKELEVNIGSKKKPNILFDNFSYEFETNKIYCIMGKSGAGKTTLVSYFNGLRKSNKGCIFINNELSILGNKRRIKDYKKIRKEIGFLFQYSSWQLCKETCLKDVMFGPLNFKIKKDKALSIATKSLKKIGIEQELFKKHIYELSNGQQKRVAIAGIIAIDPLIYIMDEPSAGLDYEGKKELISIINEFKQNGKTIIIISHDVDFALELADEILVLNDKKIMCSGDPYEVFNNKEIIKAHLVQPKIIEFINKLKSKKVIYEQIISQKPRTVIALLNILKPFLDLKGGK